MNWSDLKGIVGDLAPLVGTAIGGPAGNVIGGMLSNALGVENNPNAVSKAIKNNPEAALKLKQFELENDKEIRKAAFQTLQAELDDKANAREAHRHNPMPMIICITLTIMVACGAYMLFVMNIPADNKQIANLLFGTLLAKWGDSIAYWVGTTRSSNEKTRMFK